MNQESPETVETPSTSPIGEIPDFGPEDEASEALGGEGEGAGVPSDLMPVEAFREMLASFFKLGGSAAQLQALANAPAKDTFPPAADALYETCSVTPWLQWVLRPETDAMKRLVVILAFVGPVAMECGAELKAKRAAKAAEAKKPSAKPDRQHNNPPEPVEAEHTDGGAV